MGCVLQEEDGYAYISGSFCVSMTAAIGMPKLEAGPQKSTVQTHWVSHGATAKKRLQQQICPRSNSQH